MKTKLTNIGIMLCMVITITLTSCSSYPPPMAVPVGMARVPYDQNEIPRGPMSADQQRINGAKGFINIKGAEKLSPTEATPEAYRSIISNKRFIRSPEDGIIAEPVLRTIANGGVIGWSGHDFGFERTVQEITGVTDRLSVTDVAKGCVKYRKFPNPHSQSGRLVRARAEQIEHQRGYTLR